MTSVLGVSFLNFSGAPTLVIAATSWVMFEEIITDSDNKGKRAWLHPFFSLHSLLTVKVVIEDCSTQLSQCMYG